MMVLFHFKYINLIKMSAKSCKCGIPCTYWNTNCCQCEAHAYLERNDAINAPPLCQTCTKYGETWMKNDETIDANEEANSDV